MDDGGAVTQVLKKAGFDAAFNKSTDKEILEAPCALARLHTHA